MQDTSVERDVKFTSPRAKKSFSCHVRPHVQALFLVKYGWSSGTMTKSTPCSQTRVCVTGKNLEYGFQGWSLYKLLDRYYMAPRNISMS